MTRTLVDVSPFADVVFRRLYAAQVASLLGTGVMTVALGLLAYQLAGADAGRVLGTALAVKMIAYVVMSPVMRALVGALPAVRVLVSADVVRLTMAACLPWVTHVWQVYVLVFALQTASATFTPAFTSAIARVVPDADTYTAAISASRVAYDLESVGSPVIAAALLTVMPYSALFGYTAMGFAASAVLVAGSGLARHDRCRPSASDDATSFGRRLTAGLRMMVSRPALRIALWTNITVAAATAVVLVDTVVYVRSGIGLGDTAVAAGLGVFGAGSICAALLAPWLIRRRGVRAALWVGAALCIVGLLVTATWLGRGASMAALAATWFVLGAGTSLASTGTTRLIRDHTGAATRDDVFTAQFAASHAAYLVAYPLAGVAPAGTAGTVLVLGAMAVVGAVGAIITARRVPARRANTGELAHSSPTMRHTATT